MGHLDTRRLLLMCGVLAGPLFTVAYLIEGATRADYSALRHPVSSLALGEHGWTQTTAFLVTGLLTVAFAAGIRRTPKPVGGPVFGPLLVGVWGVGLLGAGLFRADPISGYPPSTPARVDYTTLGALHDAFSLAGFAGLTAAFFVFTRRFLRAGSPWRAAVSAMAGVETLVAYGGLLQRGAVTVGLGWLTWIGLQLLRGRGARGGSPGAWPGPVRPVRRRWPRP